MVAEEDEVDGLLELRDVPEVAVPIEGVTHGDD